MNKKWSTQSTMKSALPTSLKEVRRHGNQDFRFGFYKADPTADSFTVQPHWHEELEILYFQKGEFTLEINMECYQIRSESLYFIRSGELHRISSPKPCVESAVVFSPYLLGFFSNDAAQNRLLGPLTEGSLLLPRQVLPEHPCYLEILEEYQKIIHQCSNQDDAVIASETQQLFIKAALLNILGLCAQNHLLSSAKEPRNENIEGLKVVLSYIRAHYSEHIYVNDLAKLLNLNEQYFCRFFKKAIGQSPMAYVNTYRIHQASGMLRDTSLPVTSICLECGFNNFGNFLREFRKQTSMTPLKYRQKIRI